MKKKSVNIFRKLLLLILIVGILAGSGYFYDIYMAEDFVGNVVKGAEENYSDILDWLDGKDSDITDVDGFSFTASNNTEYAVSGGVVRYGVVIYGKNENGEDRYFLSNDVTVKKNDDITLIRDYVIAIPDDGSDNRTVSVEVGFLGRTHTFTYNVLMQDMSNTNTSILVNPYIGVGKNYKPVDTKYVGGRNVSTQAAADLQELFDAAEDDGYDIWVNSGYRSYSLQTTLYNSAVSRLGKDQNDTAKPGHSEHHTGYAVDLTWTIREGYISDRQAYDDEYFWMLENGWEYGFILRYEKGSEDITGYMFEPWHFRYIGKELATQYHNEGWHTLDEFLCIPRWDIQNQ
ncbi:MAG: D-alanyl-D-alanine carboxypeptidase family protein [Anaerofustis stercorihominis]|nr:D-alanyl-D-alanine carboxypeptidase family protein [Anaerofustis stercorihominis]